METLVVLDGWIEHFCYVLDGLKEIALPGE